MRIRLSSLTLLCALTVYNKLYYYSSLIWPPRITIMIMNALWCNLSILDWHINPTKTTLLSELEHFTLTEWNRVYLNAHLFWSICAAELISVRGLASSGLFGSAVWRPLWQTIGLSGAINLELRLVASLLLLIIIQIGAVFGHCYAIASDKPHEAIALLQLDMLHQLRDTRRHGARNLFAANVCTFVTLSHKISPNAADAHVCRWQMAHYSGTIFGTTPALEFGHLVEIYMGSYSLLLWVTVGLVEITCLREFAFTLAYRFSIIALACSLQLFYVLAFH